MFKSRWFWVGIASLFFLSLALRFWGLDRFNILVFDEVYFAKFANNYLTRTPFFDNHPPLGKYLIAIGIWVDKLFHIKHATLNSLTGSQLSPFSYRWVNALTGSLIPLVVTGIAYQLSHRRSYALIAGLLTATDGLLLVESRYALVNVYLLIFGLLGQCFFLLALDRPGRREIWLALSGICFGGCASVKWNGLAFLLGIYLMWSSAWAIEWVMSRRTQIPEANGAPEVGSFNTPLEFKTPLQNLTQIRLRDLCYHLAVIPAVVYFLVAIPHLQLNSSVGFWELQQQFLGSHQGSHSGPKSHPYCSAWYTWPLMIRPVGYFFQKDTNVPETVSSLFSLSPSPLQETYYAVQGMANPVLWWLSTLAIALLLGMLIQRIAVVMRMIGNQGKILLQPSVWIPLYLLLNYVANLLPWLKVTRCTFLYHYMGASIFSFLALAWFVDHWLRSYQFLLRAVGVTVIFLVLLAFVYWLPIYLGLPISPLDFRSRIWFDSWY